MRHESCCFAVGLKVSLKVSFPSNQDGLRVYYLRLPSLRQSPLALALAQAKDPVIRVMDQNPLSPRGFAPKDYLEWWVAM
jgi:hypothetical protein